MRPLNPVLRRELLERWRTRRAPLTLTLYLAVLGLGLYVLYRMGLAMVETQLDFGQAPDPALAGPQLGRFLFESLLFLVLMLVLFIAPGYAAAQISGERERRTLGLLQMTLLSPLQIVLGKLGASMAWLALLVVATLPLGAAAFFLGGVGMADLVRGAATILGVGVCVAAMAIGISSLTKRTTGSIVLTYGLVLALTGGTVFGGVAEYVLRAQRGEPLRETTALALYANPVLGLADAVRAAPQSGMGFMGGIRLPSPLSLAAEALPRPEDRFGWDGAPLPMPMDLMDGDALAPDIMVEAGPLPAADGGRPPVWLRVIGVYALLGLAGLGIAFLRLRGRQVWPRLRAPTPKGAAQPPDRSAGDAAGAAP